MIPAELVFLDEIPRTPSRKVDVLALPDPERTRQVLDSDYVSPQTPFEKQLCILSLLLVKMFYVLQCNIRF